MNDADCEHRLAGTHGLRRDNKLQSALSSLRRTAPQSAHGLRRINETKTATAKFPLSVSANSY